jgi:hypothetical protein
MIRGLILLNLFPEFGHLTMAQTEDSNFFYFVRITDTHFGFPSPRERASTIIDSINSSHYKRK